MKKSTSGFTIVELLVVVVVIAILATISTAAYRGIRERAVTVAYTSMVDQAQKFLEMELAMAGSLPDTGWLGSCFGRSVADFPSAGSSFESGECMRIVAGATVASYVYSDEFFDVLQTNGNQSKGDLPVTRFSGGSTTITARGVLLFTGSAAGAGYDYRIQWAPQISGQCGRGEPVSGFSGEEGSLAGGLCQLRG